MWNEWPRPTQFETNTLQFAVDLVEGQRPSRWRLLFLGFALR